MSQLYVAFYRNLNLGHQGSPSREMLETVLKDSGAKRVKSFQTNGTVLLETPDPEKVVKTAAITLEKRANYCDAVFIRTFEELVTILNDFPFQDQGDQRTYRKTFTFFEAEKPLSIDLPWTNTKDDVDIFQIISASAVALGITRKPKSSVGNPTAEIEKITGGKATTRTLGTLERLIKAGQAW